MAEMYTLQRYLASETLSAAGVEHFDAWAANFGEPVTALELAPDGSGYRMHTRFAKFVNLPELLSMFRSFADVQTADTLHLLRELKAYVETFVKRAQKLRISKVDPSVDNLLKITGDGRKAALDMRASLIPSPSQAIPRSAAPPRKYTMHGRQERTDD
jgi:N12 class adenine-specific DNA methylase